MPIIPATEKWSQEDREFKFILSHVVSRRPVWAGWDSVSINKNSAAREFRNSGKDLYSQGKGSPLWTQKRRGNVVTASRLDMRSLGSKRWPVCLSTELTYFTEFLHTAALVGKSMYHWVAGGWWAKWLSEWLNGQMLNVRVKSDLNC